MKETIQQQSDVSTVTLSLPSNQQITVSTGVNAEVLKSTVLGIDTIGHYNNKTIDLKRNTNREIEFPLKTVYIDKNRFEDDYNNNSENEFFTMEEDNLCFFFEEPVDMNSYKNEKVRKLNKEGAFSHVRWDKMKRIHIMWANPSGQIYFAKRLDLPHYQEKFNAFKNAYKNTRDLWNYACILLKLIWKVIS